MTEPGDRSPVWNRPGALGYQETLRGLGGIVAPLLSGFSLAAIATIVTGDVRNRPPYADWSVAALAAAVSLLLFSMQVAFASLTRNSTPQDVLAWRPEATVSADELNDARAIHAADFVEMSRLGIISNRAYGWGLVCFLIGLVLLLIPDKWSAPWIVAVTVTGAALALEVYWLIANRWRNLRHPVVPPPLLNHRAGWPDGPPPALDSVGLAAVIDPAREEAAERNRR